jgi:hypothetical protein
VVKFLRLLAAFLLLSATGLRADDVPFATPPSPRAGEPAYSLGDVMVQMQARHMKLWYAGRSANWGLVGYEIDRMRESFGSAATHYLDIPVKLVAGALAPVQDMRKAMEARDVKAFTRGYSELTKVCNACHEAGKVGFIKIQTPTSLPNSDESFTK